MINKFFLFLYLRNKDKKYTKHYLYILPKTLILKNSYIKFDSFYKKQHLLF